MRNIKILTSYKFIFLLLLLLSCRKDPTVDPPDGLGNNDTIQALHKDWYFLDKPVRRGIWVWDYHDDEVMFDFCQNKSINEIYVFL